jgi:hypothetical protein
VIPMFKALAVTAGPTDRISVSAMQAASFDGTSNRLEPGNRSQDIVADQTGSVGPALRAGQSARRYRNVSPERSLGICNGDTDFVAVRK